MEKEHMQCCASRLREHNKLFEADVVPLLKASFLHWRWDTIAQVVAELALEGNKYAQGAASLLKQDGV